MPVGKDSRANDIIDSILGSAHSARFPATVYLAVYSVAPDRTTNSGGTEGGYTGYARVAVANTDAQWPVAASRIKSNANDANFPTPPSDTPDYVAVALHGHVTNDDIIFWQYLPNPLRALAGEPLLVPAGAFEIRVP